MSLYVVEIKKGDSYNCFRFNTRFPSDTTSESEYEVIEDFILAEFDVINGIDAYDLLVSGKHVVYFSV